VIITKQTDVTSPAAYKQDQDVVRVKSKPVTLGSPVETFTMQFGDVTGTSCNLQLMWDNVAVSVPITTDVDSKVTAQIKELMEKDNRPYFSAAMYYVETGKDLNQALAWLEKATALNPDAFYMFYQKARVLAKLGKKQEALAVSNKSMELAKAAKSDDYVALNVKLQNELK
jgi:tetratricopeptide (TPR) repeat protein